jgi:DNA-binding CsgD family transcriptional regulator
MLEYLHIDPDTVAVLSASDFSKKEGVDEMRIVAGMIGKCARGKISRTIALHNQIGSRYVKQHLR